MGSDESGGVRRPRPLSRPRVPPGPLRDLKDLLYELYLAAGAPSLDEIAALICEDDELPGAPGRDTVRRVVGGPALPPSQADVVSVARILSRAAAWDESEAARRVRQLWTEARMAVPLGVPVEDLSDPFALEVHRPIGFGDSSAGLPTLPAYVPRAHDLRLARVVAQAANGESGVAVLVGGSSTGKTRACWEAVHALPEGWRLWHPFDPTPPEAAASSIHRVSPRTVVWLNETQRYLDVPGDLGERVAAGLRTVLGDRSRAPILILGTLWPRHWDALMRVGTPGSAHDQARLLLADNDIAVPDRFAETDLDALRKIAKDDPRLALAYLNSADGKIAQFLAGAPELLARYRNAPPAAAALMQAAIDARRLGCGPALPLDVIEAAASSYLPDDEWDALGDDWLEQALAYTGAPCRGVRGPLTRIRPRHIPAGRSLTTDPAGPLYQLSDYLEEIGRRERAGIAPPAALWEALAASADLDLVCAVSRAAESRGIWRRAAAWNGRAMLAGRADAAARLIAILRRISPADAARAGKVAAERADLSRAANVASLLSELRGINAEEAIRTLAGRHPAEHADLASPYEASLLLEELRQAGEAATASALARYAAAYADLTDPGAAGRLLEALHAAGEDDIALTVAERAAREIDIISDITSVVRFLEAMRHIGAERAIVALHSRTAAGSDGYAYRIKSLSPSGWTIHVIRTGEQDSPQDIAEELGRELSPAQARYAAGRMELTDPRHVALVLDELRQARIPDAITILLSRDVASHADISDPQAANSLLEALERTGAEEAACALARRMAAGHSDLNIAVARHVMHTLHRAGNNDELHVFAENAAAKADMSDSFRLSMLLDALHAVGEEQAIGTLLDRHLAARVDPAYSYGVAQLLKTLSRTGAEREARALARRAMVHAEPAGYMTGDLIDALAQINVPASGELNAFAQRASDEGWFRECWQSFPEWRHKFRYGREPGGSPSRPWTWPIPSE